MIRRSSTPPRSPRDLVVVTSDKALYSYARTRGARVLRAHEWNALERAVPLGLPPRRASPRTRRSPSARTDVAGWLETFGEE